MSLSNLSVAAPGDRLSWYRAAYRNLGAVPLSVLMFHKLRARVGREPESGTLLSKHANFGVRCRGNTSDLAVFHQIFVEREYRCLDHVRDPQLIIDCGANVGYSSVYFLSRFPNARVICVEPDPGNYKLLLENLAPYGRRAEPRQEAIWSSRCRLAFDDDTMAQGLEWGRTLDAKADGSVPAVDIGSLLEGSGAERISILKVDIEGAETEVFSRNFESWLDKVDNLVIELHNDEAKRVFSAALPEGEFAVSTCGELTVCTRRAPALPSAASTQSPN